MKKFAIIAKDKETNARVGVLKTKSGEVNTPLFLPVGTLGVVKTLTYEELKQIGIEAFIANTYHLYFRPGEEILKKFLGLHKFINWDRVIFTDSGGFQVYSLRELRNITSEGVEFKSHIDGSIHFFTPEKVVELQKIINSDVALCLDECVEYPVEYERAKRSVELTTLWAQRCKKKFEEICLSNSLDNKQLLFGIIQGSVYKDLRKQSVEQILEINFDGYAIGGISVGEPKILLHEIADYVSNLLPEDKPRYLMGVGEIDDVWFCVERGYDIMDCVLPTRNGRNGQALTSYGKINIKNSRFSTDESSLDEECECFVCKNYSKALIHHYFKSGELLGLRLLSYHNVYFMINLFKKIRYAIANNNFIKAKNEFLQKFYSSQNDENCEK
ncbi:MAG: tRNA guanosine(34) transglycosylase Tgt [Endomicrobia bacterium]|nr:tRNA guanosine(34) transglycosylase Tgt [Endomicrobiia bacterium]MCX7940328.1 tRNA guanosine(34) transglycosylase Tgt [Endomicrobiia bacterium]MDW8056483.1 tRNA guanosine(34) transglycosylase Tgt [Elusimicrobiota bacterium]